MFDFNFNWDSSLDTGIESIDSQHKEFFRIGRDIEQLMLIRCIGVTPEQLMSLLYSLRDFITYHFYDEEAFMASIQYPDIENHTLKHEAFKKYINSVDYTALCESPYTELEKLRTTVVDWVFHHLATEDTLIKSFYESRKPQLLHT